MYEVEMKAEISEKQYNLLGDRLCQYIVNQSEYSDVYYEHRERSFATDERELRIRKVTKGQEEKCILTYKDKPFDEISKSKPEYEVVIDDFDTMKIIIEKLGYDVDISFIKSCKNYILLEFGYEFALTLVCVDELSRFFVEIEIQEENESEIENAKEAIYKLLDRLNIDRRDLTNEYYTDAIRMEREKQFKLRS